MLLMAHFVVAGKSGAGSRLVCWDTHRLPNAGKYGAILHHLTNRSSLTEDYSTEIDISLWVSITNK
jgi:hypothetical protein